MKKCLKVIITGSFVPDYLYAIIQKNAKKYDLEGTAQQIDAKQVRLIICGLPQNLDDFLDIVHEYSSEYDIIVEPFLKEKDYRGVFRVIE